ncbi:MAG TPA: pentapeptide repeat-containing protein [Leptolyngbyaceae cyanobacterium]
MSAFREQDEKFFFGRQKFVDSLVEVVYRQPLVAVIGASGSGKSSVVFAGLIPKLREKGNWLIESFRPQNQPFFGLASALVRLLKPELDEIQQPGRAAELVADMKRELTLPQVVASILARYPSKQLLLIIDQFEELYNPRNDSEQQPFVDALLAAIQSAPNDLTVVLTLRADFLSYLLNYPTFGAALQQHKPQLLGAMNREEMQEAIECPAEVMGVKLEEGLTERILDAVKREPGNLPLLEFALEQLWRRQKNNRLTHDAYDDIKGVEKALAGYAQSVYEELTQKIDGKQIQQIFIQLVRVGEGTEDTRQLATRAEVGGDNWDLVTQLASKRLVVTGRNEATGEETVEVVHEALIREWGLLRQWIDENRKKLIQKREIEDAAKRWRDRGKAKDYLLGGKVLTEAKVFQKQEGGNLRLSDLGKEFINKSLRQRRTRTFRTASLLIIPLLIAFVSIIPFWREANEQKAWETIGNLGAGTREAVELLTEGCKERRELPGIPNSFAILLFGNCVNLSRTNLSNANLSDAILVGAYLWGANLSGANLILAKLMGANLVGANLIGADLSDATLWGADLGGAILSDAELIGAILSDADLSHANLNGANLSDADLRDADLRDANLRDANLCHVNFRNANLLNVNFSGADFSYCDGDGIRFYTDFRSAKNLTPEQVKSAKNWQQAIYDEEFRKKLGLK